MHANDILNAARRSNPDFVTGPHHETLAEALANLTPTSNKRLLIALPPRFSKTSFIGLALTDAFMAANPECKTFLATTTDSTAQAINRAHPNADRRVVGVAGRVPALAVNLGVVDDPLSMADYSLPAEQRKARINAAVDSIVGNWMHRLLPGGNMVVVCSRFAPDDVFERLQYTGDFDIINVPAVLDGRSTWPEFHSVETLTAIAVSIGPHLWSAVYQQKPLPA